jgi:superfamily II DNA helicase RecQ
MPIRIFTIPFNEGTQTFHDDLVEKFCVNKRIHKIDSQFFSKDGYPFWTVAIHYGVILEEERKQSETKQKDVEYGLDARQKEVFLKLRQWRKTISSDQALPGYIVATNSCFVEMIRQKCNTLESLKLIKGFGESRIEKYGKDIIAIIESFYPKK